MHLLPEYAPVRSLHLCFVEEFFNTRFHYGRTLCAMIHAAQQHVDVEVMVSDRDRPFLQTECDRYLEGAEKFSTYPDSSGRSFLPEYMPIFARDENGQGVGLVFEQPQLDNPLELKQFAERFSSRQGFRPLDIPFGFATAQLLVNEDLVLLSEPFFKGPEREQRLAFFNRLFPNQTFYTVPPLFGDVTEDLDMFLWPIAPRAWIVSEYPEHSPQAASIAPTLKILQDHNHSIHRVPGIPAIIYDDINTMPNYANGVIINQAALVPAYHREEDRAVCEILEQYGYQVLPIDCTDVILSNGALHCISKTVPLIT